MDILNYNNMKPVKLALLTAGLGNISRGFEMSTANWYKAIKDKEEVDVRLFSGGSFPGATKVWNWHRNSGVAALLRKWKVINDGVRLEQITFSVGLLFHLFFYRPDVIWLKEATLGDMLLRYRKIFGFKYKMVFCDGAPVGHRFAARFDFMSFLNDYALKEAIEDNADPRRCSVTPNLTDFPSHIVSRDAARETLGIDPDRFVIICVAAWNKHHKRIDYLLNEAAKLDKKKITLLLCGQAEADTDSLKEQAAKLELDVLWRTYKLKDLSLAYFASDLFVLPSLNEALGSVITEAAVHGLPAICHPHNGAKFILGEDYPGLTDLSAENNLYNKIREYQEIDDLNEEGARTSAVVRAKFDKEKRSREFVEFILYAHGRHSVQPANELS